MKSITELAGGELCLPQRPHNQVGAARWRRILFMDSQGSGMLVHYDPRVEEYWLSQQCGKYWLKMYSNIEKLCFQEHSHLFKNYLRILKSKIVKFKNFLGSLGL